MVNVRQPRDVAQILLSVLFLAIMIVACLWIVQPFILGFAWAGTVVIATWPVLLRLQKIMFGRRSLAVLVMTLLLVMVFIIPIALLVNSIVDGSGPLIKAISSGDMTLPDLAWLNTIPVIGAKLYAGWHNLLDMGGTAIMAKVRPYIGTTTTWFVGQAAHIGRFMVHCALMLLFSALLYWRGEQVAQGIRHFATRLAGVRGDAAVLLAAQASNGDLLQCGQHCNIYHSVDYGSSFAKKYCRYYVVRYRHRCYRLYTGTVYWLTQSQRNAASHAKGKYRSG